MTVNKTKSNNKNQLGNDFKINMYFDKEGQTLQKVMENSLVLYYEKAMYSVNR